MGKRYLFYDIETSGFNPAFDQIIQFAAILTDAEFAEAERHNILIRVRPDVAPSPGALLTHRIPVEKTLADGLPEYEAIVAIHRLLNRPDTISIGYNSLDFDDKFLRFSFYRNLLTPYTHQWANGCGRMDLYPITIMYWLYRPESVQWPRINGEVRLKLELLSALNDLAEGPAHDALVDVEATVALARRLREAEPAFWETCAGYFDKKEDGKRAEALEGIKGLEAYPAGLLVHPRIGRQNNFRAPVLFLGTSEVYQNQTLWLRLDEPALAAITEETVAESYVIRKRLGDVGFVLPPESKLLADERRELVLKNVHWLRNHRAILEALQAYHRQFRYPEVPDVDADAALYEQGFMKDVEKVRCQRFHDAPPWEKSALVGDFSGYTRLLAERVLARNYRLAYRFDSYQDYLRRVQMVGEPGPPQDYKGNPRRTPAEVLLKIRQRRAEGGLDADDEEILADLEAYVRYTFCGQGRGQKEPVRGAM